MSSQYYILPNNEESRWQEFEKLLSTNPTSAEELTAQLLKSYDLFSSVLPKHATSFEGLIRAINTWNIENPSQSFFSTVYPTIKRLALALPKEFAYTRLQTLARTKETDDMDHEMLFGEYEIAILVAHMFLCTTNPQSPMKYWSNFSPWFSSSYDNVQAYLKTLFHYFASWTERSPGSQDRDRDRDREISYIRRSRPARDKLWDDDISTGRGRLILPEIDIRITGSIGDTFQHVVEIDFANEDPCFGVGGTQEEILFGFSPEMAPVVLLCDTLADYETLAFKGVQKLAVHTGYGLDVKFSHLLDRASPGRIVVAMDATNFDSGSYDDPYVERKQLLRQLEDSAIQREFSKALNGFSFYCLEQGDYVIETGHWGCGAYAGNCDVKAVIQILAATKVGATKMNYYCFGDSDFADRMSAFLSIVSNNQTPYKYVVDTFKSYQAHVRSLRPREDLPQFFSYAIELSKLQV